MASCAKVMDFICAKPSSTARSWERSDAKPHVLAHSGTVPVPPDSKLILPGLPSRACEFGDENVDRVAGSSADDDTHRARRIRLRQSSGPIQSLDKNAPRRGHLFGPDH